MKVEPFARFVTQLNSAVWHYLSLATAATIDEETLRLVEALN